MSSFRLRTGARGFARARRQALAAAFAAAISVTLAACGGDSTTGPGGGANAPEGDVPSALVGRWVHGNISTQNLYDMNTGQWLANGGGVGVLFEFTADGRYTQSVLIEMNSYGCRTTVFVYNEGTAIADDEVIRLYPTRGRIKSVDSCNQQYNYDRPDDLASKQGDEYPWSMETSSIDGRTYLMITVGDGPASSFRRVQ